MPPEYIERQQISPKLDVYSLGVLVLQVIAGPEGYHKSTEMSSKAFIDIVRKKGNKILFLYHEQLRVIYSVIIRVAPSHVMLFPLLQVTENWRKRVQAKAMLLSELIEVQKCIKIGLRCVKAQRDHRPTITQIVEELDMIDFHLAALLC
jgi:serine/threonine protein kinase